MAEKDYYKILGVPRNATDAQIKSAYRKLARQYHPDVNKAPDSAAKFTEATQAYDVLSDPQKRKTYDQFGHAGPGFGGGPGPGPGGPGGRAYQWQWPPGQGTAGVDEAFGRSGFMGMSLDEILEALGGGRAGRRTRRQPPARGADMETPVTLDFVQAARGTTLELRLQVPGDNGQAHTETLSVHIPPGVDDGSRVRIKGKGAPGPAGPGDLYIVTHVRSHPYFTRQGHDVYVEVPVSIVEAALGAKVDVPTIDGMTTVAIPAGSSSSRKLRLRGKGIAGPGGQRGDHYVVIRIVPPPSLSQRGAELLKEFQAAENFNPRADVPWKSTS